MADVLYPNCPSCLSSHIIPYIYGYPSDRLLELARIRQVKLGGYIPAKIAPSRYCLECQHSFGELGVYDAYHQLVKNEQTEDEEELMRVVLDSTQDLFVRKAAIHFLQSLVRLLELRLVLEPNFIAEVRYRIHHLRH